MHRDNKFIYCFLLFFAGGYRENDWYFESGYKPFLRRENELYPSKQQWTYNHIDSKGAVVLCCNSNERNRICRVWLGRRTMVGNPRLHTRGPIRDGRCLPKIVHMDSHHFYRFAPFVAIISQSAVFHLLIDNSIFAISIVAFFCPGIRNDAVF